MEADKKKYSTLNTQEVTAWAVTYSNDKIYSNSKKQTDEFSPTAGKVIYLLNLYPLFLSKETWVASNQTTKQNLKTTPI